MASGNYYLSVAFNNTTEEDFPQTALELALQYDAFAYECKAKDNSYIFEFPTYSQMIKFKGVLISIMHGVVVKTLKCNDTYNAINL